MAEIAIETPFNIDLEFTTASFGARLLAWLLDGMVQVLYYLAFATWAEVPLLMRYPRGSMLMYLLLVALPLGLYHLLQEYFFNGQSLGKRVMGIRVVDLSGGAPSLSQYVLRTFTRPFEIGMLLGIPVAFSYGLTRYNQRIGDLLAGTIVVNERKKASIYQTIFLDVNLQNGTAMFPQVMQLSDRDINGIRNLLQARKTRDQDQYADRIAMRIQEVLGIHTDLPSMAFLQQLLEDYNLLTKG
jgi:uncharacterized RDD family membrane protein YckC